MISMKAGDTRLAPYGQAILRIVTALLFMQHGLQKLFHFPTGGRFPVPFDPTTLVGIAGLLDTFGGLLILLGLFTRPVAFILCGQSAIIYWFYKFPEGLHMKNGVFPLVNQGNEAILYCFIYLFLFTAGAGAWSLDELRSKRPTAV